MNKVCTCSFVIPIHNEEKILQKRIEYLLKELANFKNSYEIILVENGSNDGTKAICEKLTKIKNIKIIHISLPDYGNALKEGMKFATGEIIVNFDIDLISVNFAKQAIALFDFDYDVIIASKNNRLSRDKRSKLRKFISSIYKYILYYAFGLEVSDTHGIKAWRNDNVFKNLIDEVVNTKEIFDTELIIRSQYAGRKLLELPIQVIEIRNSVTHILPRALRGFRQIIRLWVFFKFNF